MKKVLFISMVSLSFVSFVNADYTVVAAHEEPAVIEQSHEICEENPFGGIYLGVGIGGSFYKNEMEGFQNQNVNRFIGTVALGAGKVFKDVFYLGLEGMMDFTTSKNKTVYQSNGEETVYEAKNNGFIPSVGIRFGFTKNSWLVYGKVSASHASCEIKHEVDNSRGFKVDKFVPAFAIGVEKAFCRKFSARLEGEYRLASKKGMVEVNKGFTLRALVQYNVKI